MSDRRLPWRFTEAMLWICGAVLLAIVGFSAIQARSAEDAASRIRVSPAPSAPIPSLERPVEVSYTGGELIGRLEIPKVGLLVPVLESYDPATLVRGVGHVPGTALPGGLGYMVLVGHRDTFFRPLKNILAGMEIDVVTASNGTSRYAVDSTEIVTPDQVQVTVTGDRPGLTLITCFPFNYIGAAPRRFIVQAHLISVNPA